MPQRIGELSVLPVFFKLEGRHVLLAGGTKAAAWKAELLAASGATVHIYAKKLDPYFAQLRNELPTKGTFFFHNKTWTKTSFEEVSLAVCDGEDIDAELFCDTARSLKIPVNIIDKPALCDFQFGSIVNRSPVVVSISTNGAAPILGQAIRRRIEALLPQSLSLWGKLACSLRIAVNQKLHARAERRAFWQNFSQRAFTSTPDKHSAMRLLNSIQKISSQKTSYQKTSSQKNIYQLGKVTSLEINPLDLELLTLKEIRILQSADIILYDPEISPSILELARREAEHIPVIASKHIKGCNPDQANPTMKSLVKAGKNVVRLHATCIPKGSAETNQYSHGQ